MEQKKRKVITYHSTVSNKKLERELNKGYHIEFCQPLRSHLVMVLVKDEKEIFSPFEIRKNENVTDFVKLELKGENYVKQKDELFKKGYKLHVLTTQNALFVKKAEKKK